MKRYEGQAVFISAVAGGVIAGALLGASRPRKQPSFAIVPVEPVLELPAPQPPEHEWHAPVIYEARVRDTAGRRWLPWVLATFVAALACGFAGFASGRPAIVVAAPANVRSGTAAAISYRQSGHGNLDVLVDSGSYHSVQSLRQNEGRYLIPVQALHAGTDVTATFRLRGWLGTDTRSVRFPVIAPPHLQTRVVASNSPLIRSFALSKMAARGGDRILASYDTNSPVASIRVVDAAGVTWSSRAVRGKGVAFLPVPRMHSDTPFIVNIQAQRNHQSVTASAGFIAQAVPESVDAGIELNASPSAAPTFDVPSTLREGATVPVTIPAGISHVSVALSARDGRALATFTQASGQQRIALRVPSVGSAQSAFATLSYQHGKTKETLIRRVTILASP